MKKKFIVAASLALVVVVLVVVLVACSQAGQQAQQEPQDMRQVVQQTEPVTAEPEEPATTEPMAEPTVEPTPEPTAEPTTEPTPESTPPTESTICSSDELIALFEMAYESGLKQRGYYTEEDALLKFELDCLVFKAKNQLGKELPSDYIEQYIGWRPIEDGSTAPAAQGGGVVQGGGGASGSGEASGPSEPSFSDEDPGDFSIDYGPDYQGPTEGTHLGGPDGYLHPDKSMDELLKEMEELTGWRGTVG